MRQIVLIIVFALSVASPAVAQRTPAFGPRAGFLRGPDAVFLGVQTELSRGLDGGVFAPSVDFALEDDGPVSAQFDFRWYLFRLPGTGLRVYGATGPEVVLSPDTEVGLDLTAGPNVPMSGGRRYNVELRWGFADVPDFAVAVGVLFALR